MGVNIKTNLSRKILMKMVLPKMGLIIMVMVMVMMMMVRTEQLLVSNRQNTFDRQLDPGHLGRFGSQVELSYEESDDDDDDDDEDGEDKLQATLLEELVSAGPCLRIPVSRQRR